MIPARVCYVYSRQHPSRRSGATTTSESHVRTAPSRPPLTSSPGVRDMAHGRKALVLTERRPSCARVGSVSSPWPVLAAEPLLARPSDAHAQPPASRIVLSLTSLLLSPSWGHPRHSAHSSPPPPPRRSKPASRPPASHQSGSGSPFRAGPSVGGLERRDTPAPAKPPAPRRFGPRSGSRSRDHR
ncbi:hypothetical protein CDD83_9291 [Cordyceps sp. RAO-2017]|nr:hypothetical protein CDD83_9291 [Cordyceps sp. RAO-2017]